MIKLLCVFLLLLASVSSHAIERWSITFAYRVGLPATTGVSVDSRSAEDVRAAVIARYGAGVDYIITNPGVYCVAGPCAGAVGSPDFTTMPQGCYLATAGVVYDTLCRKDPCTAGEPSSMSYLTTIASFDSFGRSVPAGVMPNPQCGYCAGCYEGMGCTVVRPTGGQSSSTCYGSIDGNSTRVVGAQIFVTCGGDGENQTGATCNGSFGDDQAITAEASEPTGFVPDSGTPPPPTSNVLTPQESAAVLNTSSQSTFITNNTLATAQGVTNAVNALNGIVTNQATAETNAEARQTELVGIFNGIKGVLDSINTKTGTGGSSGIPADGLALTGDGGGLGADPVPDTPAGGLKSPGEDVLTDFKTTLNATGERASGTCPTWTMVIDYFDRSFVLDVHCQLFDNNRATFEAIMTVVWSVMALGVVLRA